MINVDLKPLTEALRDAEAGLLFAGVVDYPADFDGFIPTPSLALRAVRAAIAAYSDPGGPLEDEHGWIAAPPSSPVQAEPTDDLVTAACAQLAACFWALAGGSAEAKPEAMQRAKNFFTKPGAINDLARAALAPVQPINAAAQEHDRMPSALGSTGVGQTDDGALASGPGMRARNAEGSPPVAATPFDVLKAPGAPESIQLIADAWNNLDPEHRIAVEYSSLFDRIAEAAATPALSPPAPLGNPTDRSGEVPAMAATPKGQCALNLRHSCPNMKCTYEGMDGERYRCQVCGDSYFLDYEEMR